jgi:hypothetical protein
MKLLLMFVNSKSRDFFLFHLDVYCARVAVQPAVWRPDTSVWLHTALNDNLPALVAAFKCQQVPAVFLIFIFSLVYKQRSLLSRNDRWKRKLPFVDDNAKYCHNACVPGVMMICRVDNVWVFETHCARGGLLFTAVSARYLTLYSVHFPFLQVTWRCPYPVS